MTAPAFLNRFVDDAATFPPGNLPLADAVVQHRAHRTGPYAELVGGFVVSDLKIPDLPATPLELNVVISGGAGAIEPAVTWVHRSEGLTLRAVEFALRDEEDLAHNARRLVTVVQGLGEALDDVTVFAEPPMPVGDPTHGWSAALDELAAAEIPLKFRTGGVTADLFPSPEQLAICLEAALDRELSFKCTAGLHHAVRHRDAQTGIEHHGFLNVLLATRTSLDGGGVTEVARTLEDSDGAAIAARLADDPDLFARTRRWFTSFGSCSVREAYDDLVDLDLMGDAR